MKPAAWLQKALAVILLGSAFAQYEDTADQAPYEKGTVRAPNPNPRKKSASTFIPFATDEPSKELFQRSDGLGKLAPIINVDEDLVGKVVPTNAWWGNLIHTTPEDIDTLATPAWSNPYALLLPKEAPFGLQVCYSYTYRELADQVDGVSKYYLHKFHYDLVLSASEFGSTKPDYKVYSFSMMGVELRTCESGTKNCMDSALVHGMAFVSASYTGLTPKIESKYAMTLVDKSTPGKYVVQLENNQTWVIFASDTSASFSIDSTGSALVGTAAYKGTVRVAVLPEGSDRDVYDKYTSCIVRGGEVSVKSRTSYSFDWETEGAGCDSTGLLHFALPHQVEVMDDATTTKSKGAIVLNSSTRGKMVGQVTKSLKWTLSEPEAEDEVDFYPATKLSPEVVSEIKLLSILKSDIESEWSLDTGSWYFNGKAYQKYASLCLMAADSAVVGQDKTLLETCLTKLETLISPFLKNNIGSPLVYETTYGGIITSQIFDANDVNVDFGNAVYNDHHYHWSYWITASAILMKLHPSWSEIPQLKLMVGTMLRDVVNPSSDDVYFPKFRHFSWYLGHSYSHGVTPMADGKDEESTSEDVNFFYGMMLWGKVTKNKAVEDLGSLMLRLNAHSVRTYFLITSDSTIHPPEFAANHVTGIFFDSKADYATWFSAEKYCIHGIQMIPVSPINGLVRSPKFIQEEWDDILSKEAIVTERNTSNAWLSLLLVNQAVINNAEAIAQLATATMDDGLTRSWALYNAASRGNTKSAGKSPKVDTEDSTVQSVDATPDVAATKPASKSSNLKNLPPKVSEPSVAGEADPPVTLGEKLPARPSPAIRPPSSPVTPSPAPPPPATSPSPKTKGPGWTEIPPGWTPYTPGVVSPEQPPNTAPASTK